MICVLVFVWLDAGRISCDLKEEIRVLSGSSCLDIVLTAGVLQRLVRFRLGARTRVVLVLHVGR